MNRKSVGFVMISLLLTGCVSGPNVTKEDALEVAVDDSDNDLEIIESSEVTDENGAYHVEFTAEGTTYKYVIDKDGLIQKREFSSSDDQVEQKEPEQPKEEKTEQTKEQEQTEQADPKKEQAEDAALLNAGLTRGEVTSITSKLNAEKTEYTVVIVAGDIKTTSIVDANSGEVLSTSFE